MSLEGWWDRVLDGWSCSEPDLGRALCVHCSHMSPLPRGPCHRAHLDCVCLSLEGLGPLPQCGVLSKWLWSLWRQVGDYNTFARCADPSLWGLALLRQHCASENWLWPDNAQGPWPLAEGPRAASDQSLDLACCRMEQHRAGPGGTGCIGLSRALCVSLQEGCSSACMWAGPPRPRPRGLAAGCSQEAEFCPGPSCHQPAPLVRFWEVDVRWG